MKAYEIIYQQLGEKKFKIMTSATIMCDGDNTLIAKIKGSKKYNHIDVTLNSLDLYNVRFLKQGTAKQLFEIKREETFENVYCEDLKSLIESETGLFLSL